MCVCDCARELEVSRPLAALDTTHAKSSSKLKELYILRLINEVNAMKFVLNEELLAVNNFPPKKRENNAEEK